MNGKRHWRARNKASFHLCHIPKYCTDLLELPIFQNAHDKLEPRVAFRFFLLRLRQHHARFDLKERRRHNEKRARDLHVELAHLIEVKKVLPRKIRYRNVVDVNPIPLNAVHQEIHWSFKDGNPYRIVCHFLHER